MSALLPALLAGAAVATALAPPVATARLGAVLPRVAPSGPPRGSGVGLRGAGRGALPARLATPRSACVLAGVALALVLGGPTGATLGLVVALGGPAVLARLEPRAVRADREALTADLPLALDLLAACLAGGAALPAALHAVAGAVPGPCGARLGNVAASLDVGSPPGEAWAVLSSAGDDLARSAARALTRGAEGGAPVAAAVAGLAAEARSQARSRGEQAAERAGVLAVAPLGACFLPAFVLLGVVPVVAGLLGPLLSTL